MNKQILNKIYKYIVYGNGGEYGIILIGLFFLTTGMIDLILYAGIMFGVAVLHVQTKKQRKYMQTE